MAQKPKNPLNVMFGAFMQNERKNYFNNLSVLEVARDKLNMSVSLYKMTEAGLASFSLNRLLLLVETFKDSDSNIVFDRLLKFVSGQNIVDNLITNKKLSPKDSFAELANVDDEFRNLFLKTERYFDYEEDSKEMKDFIQNEAILEVRRFLQEPAYTIEIKKNKGELIFDKQLLDVFKNAPSLNIGLLYDFIKSFSEIIPLHFQEIAAKWEVDNAKHFKELVGLFDIPELIISKKNFKTFHHSYLLEGDFTKVRYIFCEKSGFKNKDDIKKQYQIMLNQSRKENKLAEIPENIFTKKVSIEILETKDIEIVRNILRAPNNLSTHLQAFWSFYMKADNNKIGFAGVVQSDVNVVYNLSYSEAMRRSDLFDNLWDSLQNR